MMKRSLFTASAAFAAFALTPVPALAQEAEEEQVDLAEDGESAGSEVDEMEAAMAMLGSMFEVEPLTAEQQARLPLAESIVLKMMPDGALGEMMDGMFDQMLNPIMEMAPDASTTTVAQSIGVTAFEIELEEDKAAEIASLFDPSWKEREERQREMVPAMISEILTVMEPSMRKAMGELYAINFSVKELTEIDAFFSTETGATFARKSFTMASDPRIVGASMEAMPQMMQAIAGIEERMAEATADLPEARSFADLSDAEKAQVAEATGFTVEEIEANLEGNAYDWSEDEAAAEADEAEE